jgi:hypothetical protein
MSVLATFRLRGGTPLTETRLDSALARAEFKVSENPQGAGRWEHPPVRNAWVRREGERVHLRVEDDSAVAAFLQPKSDWGAVVWCQRDAAHGIIVVPIDRR